MIQVSVIIINYNTASLVEQCINSVYAKTKGIEFEIILVDNNSSDRAIMQVAACFEEVQFIQLPSNLGFGNACNRAVERANGTHLFFLNSDAFLCNNAINLMYCFYTKNEFQLQLSCLGSMLVNVEGKAIHSHSKFPTMKAYLIKKISSFLLKVMLKKESLKVDKNTSEFYKVDYVTGASLLISKKNFDKVSGFDPVFFLYFEETDLQLQLSKLGRQSYVLKGPSIVHVQGASTDKNNSLLRFYYFNSMHLYFKKHNNSISYFIFKVCWCIVDIKTVHQNLKIKWKNR